MKRTNGKIGSTCGNVRDNAAMQRKYIDMVSVQVNEKSRNIKK